MYLKDEITNILKEHGKTTEDVLWAGTKNYKIPLDLFWDLTKVHYDSGFGSVEILETLIVVGKDFWLERHEYDGSEWFEYKQYPSIPEKEWEPESLKNSWEARLCSI